jgi:threonine synthase
MDILISSNLERFLFVTLGAEKTADYMYQLNEYGKYNLSEDDFARISESFVGYYTSEEETADTIKDIYENKNCLIDTHTAVAVHATECFVNENGAERKILVVSTASAYKFANDVLNSLRGYKASDDVSALPELNAYTKTEIPLPLASVAKKKILHTQVINKDDMETNTFEFAKA